jgi:ATP-dependent DNA helicase RecG
MNSEQLIKDLIKQGESEQLEFMEVVRTESIAKTLCSFLNGSGGRVVIGVTDDGKVIGLENVPEIEQELKEFLVTAIVPDSPINYFVENIGQKQVLVLKVWGGSKQPYIFDGSIFYRRGAGTQKATSKEISELIHGRQLAEQHWERQISLGVELDDLDKKLISDTINESRKNHRSNF